MPQPTMLVIAAGLSIAGAAIGVGVGHATIDQINPADFKDPDPPFYADLAPSRSHDDWGRVQAQEYQAAAQAPPTAGCAGCTWPVAPMPQQDPNVARYDQPRTAVVPRERAEAPVRIVVVEPPPEPDWGRVERYSRYQVDRNGDPAPRVDGDDDGDGGTQ